MTADDIEPKIGEQCAYQSTANLPPEIVDMLEHLCSNNNIIFKSQQRNEPELQKSEKFKVALNVYQRNPQTFLMRFGRYLEEVHLLNFARISIAESDDEMHLMIKEYQMKLKTRQRDVKNRRYAALQKLIEEGEYFSEQEMMKRSPELYQELVGQYLSHEEKKQRDSYDVRNTTFSGILMHNLVQKQISEIMDRTEEHKKNENVKQMQAEDGGAVPVANCYEAATVDDEIPANCRQQWGNFDSEQIACSTSRVENTRSSKKSESPTPVNGLITADERSLLRQEFVSQMHEQFLSGKDTEFDYTAVDDNTQFDDLIILNQDKEDKYFEESDDDEEDEGMQRSVQIMNEDESEDELDMYMSHLNKHHSLQN